MVKWNFAFRYYNIHKYCKFRKADDVHLNGSWSSELFGPNYGTESGGRAGSSWFLVNDELEFITNCVTNEMAPSPIGFGGQARLIHHVEDHYQ
jgi:hypothetical protein